MQRLRIWQWIYSYASSLGNIFSWLIPTLITIAIAIGYGFAIQPYGWWVIIIGVIILVAFYVTIFSIVKRKLDSLNLLYENIEALLKQDMVKHSAELHARKARMYPDEPFVNLSVYSNAITKIKSKGYFEFEGDNLGSEFDTNHPILLSCVTPGMFKFFMVASQGMSIEPKGPRFRIYAKNSDERDFTVTWFNHILPIIGNLASTISEKLVGQVLAESPGDYYEIYKYKVIQKGKILKLRIYIA